MPWMTTLRGSRRAPSANEMLLGSLQHDVSAVDGNLSVPMFGDLLVKPFGWMGFVSLDGAWIWVDAGELDVFAEIVPAVHAEEAFSARDAGLDGHSVAYPYI